MTSLFYTVNQKFSPLIRFYRRILKLQPAVGRRFSTTRFSMYNNLEAELKKLEIRGKVLLISEGQEHSLRNMLYPNCEFITTSFPKTDATNLHKYPNNSFDAVISDQVLEHTCDPFGAIVEIHRILKKGGIAINTSCAFNPIHDKVDYFRFMPAGFTQLHRPFRKIIASGFWGNRETIWRYAKDGYKSFDVRLNQRDKMLATRVDADWPWSVWCIARK